MLLLSLNAHSTLDDVKRMIDFSMVVLHSTFCVYASEDVYTCFIFECSTIICHNYLVFSFNEKT
jgi:hypothetical protein